MSDDLDIRPTLRNRLKSIDAQLAELTKRREALAALRGSLEQTLAQEDALQSNGAAKADTQINMPLHSTAGRGLSDLIVKALANGPKTLDQLKGVGEGWPVLKDHSSPGRAINFALVGLQRGGRVERLENDSWKLVPGESRKGIGAPALTGAPRQ